MKRIRIKSIRLHNFRNYERLDCSFNEHINVITGLNGAGKTSILDAIYYLSNGKSYFSHLDGYIYRNGTDYFTLHSKHYIGDEKFELAVLSSSDSPKQVKVDDKLMKSLSEFVGRFPAFMIAPKDILILVESSLERRKLMDRTISQVDPVYFRNLLFYNKILRQRNAALKNFIKSGRRDLLMLDALDERMTEPAQYIHSRRSEYIEEVSPRIELLYRKVSGDRETVSIAYKSKMNDFSMAAILKDYRERDLVMGKTNQGIHRDDIKIKLDGQDIRNVGSQGQLKSAIVAIKIAQVEWVKSKTEKSALILLDDIFDKLDSGRVMNLIDICANELNAQIFISDTEHSRVTDSLEALGLEYQFFEIIDAKIADGR